MDQAVSGLTARMASLSPAARANIKTALRQDPGLADRALEAIEMEATNVGVPIRRRLQLRVMGKQIARRLRQSPDMLIDEYITKCRKAAAQSGTSAQVQRHTAAQLGPETLKTRVEETETAIQHWQTLGVGEGLIGYQLLEGEGADGSALRGGSGPRKKKYNQKEKVKGAKRKSVVLPKRPRVRVITPEIRRSLFGTSWIQGSCMSVDEKMLVLKEEGVNSVLKIPLASITAFGVIREPGGLQDQWEQVALPIPQTLLDELAERAERTTQAERDALLKHAAYGYSTEPSDGWYNVGGWLFGFGLITTTVGWILILLGDGTGADALLVPGVIFGVTIGPLSVLGALLILLLGAMIDIGDGTSQPRQEQ
jgi:hypothetical protein